MFFDSWYSLGRVIVACVVGYVAVVLIVRVSGKRALSRMNAFDFVVNVALGSTLATLILSSRTPIVNGLAAFVVLAGLQRIIAILAMRSDVVHGLVKAQPALLFYRGEMYPATMRRERITEDEVRAAIRGEGLASFEEVEAVVLETSGTLAVVRKARGGDASALCDLGPPASTAARRAHA